MIVMVLSSPNHRNDISELLEKGDSALGTTRRLYVAYGTPVPSPEDYYSQALKLLEGSTDEESRYRAHMGLGRFYSVTAADEQSKKADVPQRYRRALHHFLQAYEVRQDAETGFELAQVALIVTWDTGATLPPNRNKRHLVKVAKELALSFLRRD